MGAELKSTLGEKDCAGQPSAGALSPKIKMRHACQGRMVTHTRKSDVYKSRVTDVFSLWPMTKQFLSSVSLSGDIFRK